MKTVVITGVSRGIGEALAKKFLDVGFRVIGTSTSGQAMFSNPNLEIIKLDLTNASSIKYAGKEITARAPTINVLINNAGMAQDEEAGKINLTALRKDLEVNLFGLIDLAERLVPFVHAGGQIINISSIMGKLTGEPEYLEMDYPAYRISKTALNMYTKTLASRLRNQEITVSAVHPGWVKTELGGEGATRDPKEAAEQIYKLATTPHETGLFWYDNKQIPW